LEANKLLVENNARCAARIAKELSALALTKIKMGGPPFKSSLDESDSPSPAKQGE